MDSSKELTVEELDRGSPQPLYDQIVDKIVSLIEETPLLPNKPIPSERQLAESFGVSRMTVRKAINQLVEDRTLFRQPGKGTYVALRRIRQPLLVIRGFSEAMEHLGHVPDTQIHDVQMQPSSARIARQLGIEIGAPIVKLVRVGYMDGLALALITSYLPHDLMPGLTDSDFDTPSLYALLRERCGLRLARQEVTLEPTVASFQEAELLSIPVGLPLMLLRGTVYAETDRVCEYYKVLYRGDSVVFAAETELHDIG